MQDRGRGTKRKLDSTEEDLLQGLPLEIQERMQKEPWEPDYDMAFQVNLNYLISNVFDGSIAPLVALPAQLITELIDHAIVIKQRVDEGVPFEQLHKLGDALRQKILDEKLDIALLFREGGITFQELQHDEGLGVELLTHIYDVVLLHQCLLITYQQWSAMNPDLRHLMLSHADSVVNHLVIDKGLDVNQLLGFSAVALRAELDAAAPLRLGLR